MRTRVVSVLAALAVAVLTFTASPAQAAVLTITGSSASGAVTGHAGATSLTDTSTGVSFTCAGSDAMFAIPNGTRDGSEFGHVDSLTFTSCTGPLGLSFSITTSGFPWPINADIGYITSVQARLTGAGCDATIAGSVPIIFTGATLVVLPQGDTLTVTNVSATDNCFGLVRARDIVQLAATYMLTPNTINITSS